MVDVFGILMTLVSVNNLRQQASEAVTELVDAA